MLVGAFVHNRDPEHVLCASSRLIAVGALDWGYERCSRGQLELRRWGYCNDDD